MAQIKKKPQQSRTGNIAIIAIILLIITTVMFYYNNDSDDIHVYNYTELIAELESGSIATMNTKPVAGDINIGSYDVTGKLSDGSKYESIIPNEFELSKIIEEVTLQNVEYNPEKGDTYTFLSVLSILIPIIIVIALFMFLMRNNQGNNKAFDFGKSKAKLNKGKTTTFKNVAGVDEEKQELEELIDFLGNPKKYMELGARIPTGVLLVGPPGTGKTLLARAVAGEANVPFYSISGSDFVEMFVGVGASRVRDMFKAARQNAPCIVFIDEIDAVGRQRGTGVGGGHDEREQTLNQLLVEMDGFGSNSGVIVIAATNRADVLDPALLRPGRFDRQITIGRPDIRGREAILKVHAKNKKISPKVTF